MIRLRIGMILSVLLCFFVLGASALSSIPDGKLHLIFCSVGQGDGAYIRFPDGRDMIIDAGPGKAMINCLSRHMPFWDRTIDIVAYSHPQSDHIGGLPEVLRRYTVRYIVSSDVAENTDIYKEVANLITTLHIERKYVTAGETIDIGSIHLTSLWPTKEFIAQTNPLLASSFDNTSNILGASKADVNDYCEVFHLSYGSFDALFPGDADSQIDGSFAKKLTTSDGDIDVWKIPHHGSRTGVSATFFSALEKEIHQNEHPVAIISVGKNSYGHPSPEIVEKLKSLGFSVHRTDEEGDIEIVSDGNEWNLIK
jgi:competence protein ComEC